MKTIFKILKWVFTAIITVVLLSTGVFFVLAIPFGIMMGLAATDGLSDGMNRTFKNHR